jgi:hypothetical protein
VKPVSIKTIIPIIMAIMVIAGAVAMWSDILKINATIKTGEVKVKFSSWTCSDEGSDPQGQGFHNEEGKNVASCNVEASDGENPITLSVTLNNTYPGYSVDVTFTVDNIGTIPVKLLNYNIIGVDPNALSVSLSVPKDTTQIDPGGNSTTYTLHITVLQSAAKSSTYTFEVDLTFAQWNEV